MNVYSKLLKIQSELKSPKSNYNSFGKYSYRSCEDILESLKPLLKENNSTLFISDKIVQIEHRFYIEATATFVDAEKGEKIEVSALAREDETKKGMDLAQITGSVSSYARKYALNGLFCIDDTKDPDSTNEHGKGKQDKPKTPDKPKTNNSFEQKEYKCSDCGCNIPSNVAKYSHSKLGKVLCMKCQKKY